MELPSPGLHRDDGSHGPALLLQLQTVSSPHLHHTQPHTDLLRQRLPGEIALQAGTDGTDDLTTLRPHLEHLLAGPGDDGEVLGQLAGGDPSSLNLSVVVAPAVLLALPGDAGEAGEAGPEEGLDVVVLPRAGVGVEAPPPPVIRAQHHDLPAGAQRGAVGDLHQDRGEEGGGRELEDPGDEALPVTQGGQVEDLLRSQLSHRQSQRLLRALGWNNNSQPTPPAACSRKYLSENI